MISQQFPSFQVLDRNLNIHRNYLLEASAGTGKTFAVENLFVRFLIEGPNPLELQEILAVTFTRVAARDLKRRIRSKIEDAIHYLDKIPSENTPDYLQAVIDQGDESLKQALKRLKCALFYFDQAQIYTIHSFCHRLLRDHLFESGISLDVQGGEDPLPTTKMLQVIQDFFRTEIHSEMYSKEQFRKLAKTQEELEELKEALLNEINKGEPECSSSGFVEQLSQFCKIMTLLKSKGIENSSKIEADFIAQAPFYKEICDRQGNIKSENQAKIERFASLFNKETWGRDDLDQLVKDGLYICEVLHPTNRKAKGQPPILQYPNLVGLLQEHLEPLIDMASHKKNIFKKMASHCYRHLKHYMEQEELQNYDDLLKEMLKAVNSTSFCEKVKLRYKAAIIDEFQDTDPVQWEIFQKLFLSKKDQENKFLYLVGDPKQAIYAFRKADIYTYIEASHAIQKENLASLDTNYRSNASLIQALNFLFSSSPSLIPLPKLKTNLNYQSVHAGHKDNFKELTDGKGSIHFFSVTSGSNTRKKNLEMLETTYFFPFIIQEIALLKTQSFHYQDCAILVADRYQAERMANALKAIGIPHINQRQEVLSNTPALAAMRELLTAIISPQNESILNTALAGIIFGWSTSKLEELKNVKVMEDLLIKFNGLRKVLYQTGFLPFFTKLMDEDGHGEQLLVRQGGSELYHDLYYLAELLGSYQSKHSATPEGLLSYLDHLQYLPQSEDQALKRRGNLDQTGVKIQTIHSSKGLEFEVVFTLGLINRTNHLPECGLEEEQDAEKMRLLYVAFTRAKYRVYAPMWFQKTSKMPFGSASPMELLLARLGQPEQSYDQIYENIKTLDPSSLFHFFKQMPEIKLTDLDQALIKTPPHQTPIAPSNLIRPPFYSIQGKQKYIYSYSSLVKAFLSHQLSHEKETSPHDFAAVHKTSHTIPSGNAIGNLLHQILEVISFKNPVESSISRYVQGSEFEDWKEVINKMIHLAINAPLPLGSKNVPLNLIDTHKIYRETEFLYAMKNNPGIEGFNYADGFLKGVIDLLFEYEGQYYILDWKSNWLGPSIQNYERPFLEEAMHKNNYFLQARIYAMALKQFLKQMVDESFHTKFGGVIYVFLRGLDLDLPQSGIYHFVPNTDD